MRCSTLRVALLCALVYGGAASAVAVRPRPVAAPAIETRRGPASFDRREAGVYCGDAAAERFVAEMPTLRTWSGGYAPPAALRNGHAHTIFAAKLRRTAAVRYARDVFATDDGGSLALDLLEGVDAGDRVGVGAAYGGAPTPVADGAPFLLLLSGLGGGSQDTYVRAMAAAAAARGWRCGALNMRSCGGSEVTSPRFFSARRGAVDDVEQAVRRIRRDWRPSRLCAVGWSNSGTIVVNALAAGLDVDAACALAAPLDMPASSANLRRPFHRVYDRALGASLARKFRAAQGLFVGEDGAPVPVPAYGGGAPFVADVDRAATAKSVRELDAALTAPCFGFPSVDAYYADASCDQRVARVERPLLVVNAADDPIARFTTKAGAFDAPTLAANPNVVVALTERGGHLGWCDAADPTGPPAWVQTTALDFLDAATR